MDRRQKKTRDAIFKAFTALLESKSYSGITVQDIIDEADIGRSTFYAHFGTKDDLLREMCAEIFDHVFSDGVPHEKTHDFSGEAVTIGQRLTHMLYHFVDSRHYIKGILSRESGDLFMFYFKQRLNEVFADLTPALDGVSDQYVLNHMVSSFAETVRWWIRDNPAYKPEEVVAFYLAVVPLEQQKSAGRPV